MDGSEIRGRDMEEERSLTWFIVFVLMLPNVSGDNAPRIALPQGYVTGITIFTDSNVKVNAYLGLPYALPPIGNLRFAPPERHPGWNRTLFGGHFRPDCPQIRHEGEQSETDITNEDCLYLNVFVPEDAMTYRNFPVVVFVHGIDYVAGSPLIVNAEDLAKEGVIVVTFSYRLNVFGFLTFEDEYARGNLGLLDQYMAFMWVRENIQYFGGLGNNITIMGHGSGASSLLVHMTSPRTENLFQRVIIMSGSIFSPWLRSHPRSSSHPAMTTSKIIARSLGCYGDNYEGQKSRSVLACLRQKTSEEIVKAFQSAYQNGNWSNSLGPISDDFLPAGNRYLPEDPTEAFRLGRYHRVPVLTGITCNEGTLTLHNWKEVIGQREDTILRFMETTAVSNVLEKYSLNTPEVRKVVTWYYSKKNPGDSKHVDEVLKLYNDAMFDAPFWRQTRTLAKYNDRFPVFVYLFTQPSFDYLGNYGQLLNLTESVHGSELPFLFGPSMFQKVAGRGFTMSEERLSLKMKRLWLYFIRLGDPTPPSYGYSLWDRYDVERESLLKLYIDPDTGRNLAKVTGNPNKEGFTLWNSLLPALHETTMEKVKKLEDLLDLAGASNIGTNSGCSSYKNAMFTTLAFLILLLIMLVLSLVFLKRRTKQRDRCVL